MTKLLAANTINIMNENNRIAPYGYALDTDNVTLKPVQQEQEVLALMRTLLSNGLTIGKIATELKRRELLTSYYLTIGEETESGLALPEYFYEEGQ